MSQKTNPKVAKLLLSFSALSKRHREAFMEEFNLFHTVSPVMRRKMTKQWADVCENQPSVGESH